VRVREAWAGVCSHQGFAKHWNGRHASLDAEQMVVQASQETSGSHILRLYSDCAPVLLNGDMSGREAEVYP
jgi:hypothetical protein